MLQNFTNKENEAGAASPLHIWKANHYNSSLYKLDDTNVFKLCGSVQLSPYVDRDVLINPWLGENLKARLFHCFKGNPPKSSEVCLFCFLLISTQHISLHNSRPNQTLLMLPFVATVYCLWQEWPQS